MSKLKTTIAYLGPVAIGISDAVSVAFPIYILWARIYIAIIVGFIVTMVTAISSYALSGLSIINADNSTDEYRQLNENVPLLASAPTTYDRRNAVNIGVQLMMWLLTITIVLGNRYLLLSSVADLFDLKFDWEWKLVLSISTFLNTLFSSTNENWASQQLVASLLDRPDTVVNKYWLWPLAPRPTRICIRAIGSVEQTSMEDLLPWFALMPKEAIQYLGSHYYLRSIVISLAVIIGLPLSIVFFMSTWLFNGKNTEDHLRSIHLANDENQEASLANNDIPTTFHQPHTQLVANALQHSSIFKPALNLVGPANGASAAAPVMIMIRSLVSGDIFARLFAVWGSGLAIFSIVALYVHYSEVGVAKKELHLLAGDEEEEIYYDAFGSLNTF